MVDFREKVAWTSELKQFLAPAMAHDPLNSICALEDDINKGICSVVAGYERQKIILAFVTRIDVGEFGKELVIVAGASQGHGNTKRSIPVFVALAKKYGCEYIRIHTRLKALGRILYSQGFEFSEMVLRKQV